MAAPDGDRILRVDMTTQTASFNAFTADRKLLGGRALSAKILLEECDPKCDALGPDNVLVMAPGGLSAQRWRRGAARGVGGRPSPADPDRRYGLVVNEDGAKVVEADEYKGL